MPRAKKATVSTLVSDAAANQAIAKPTLEEVTVKQETPSPASAKKTTKKGKKDVFVKVTLNAMTKKVAVQSEEALPININLETATDMMHFVKGNTGMASYKLVIEGMSVGNVIDMSKDTVFIYQAPLSYWELLIEVADLIANANSSLSFQLGRQTTYVKEKKTLTITRKPVEATES